MGKISQQLITLVAQLRDTATKAREGSTTAEAQVIADELRSLCAEVEQLAKQLDKYEDKGEVET